MQVNWKLFDLPGAERSAWTDKGGPNYLWHTASCWTLEALPLAPGQWRVKAYIDTLPAWEGEFTVIGTGEGAPPNRAPKKVAGIELGTIKTSGHYV